MKYKWINVTGINVAKYIKQGYTFFDDMPRLRVGEIDGKPLYAIPLKYPKAGVIE